MPIKTPQVVSPLPLPPNPADRSTFNTRAYPWSEALATWTDQVNQLGADTLENAQSAQSDASSASSNAGLAAGYASSASTGAGLALGYKDAAYGSQQAAAGSASTASTASGQAQTARDLASQWASDTTVVADGFKGARGYAQDAAQSAAEAAQSASGAIAPSIHAAIEKTTPADADEFPIVDSAASWSLKKLTWGNLKAAVFAAFKVIATGGSANATLGLGYAATAPTVGDGVDVMRVGAFGFGAQNPLNNTYDVNDIPAGQRLSLSDLFTEADATALNLPALGGLGTDPRSWHVECTGIGTSRLVQTATEVFGVGTTKGRTFTRVKQDAIWYPWQEVYSTGNTLNIGATATTARTALNLVADASGVMTNGSGQLSSDMSDFLASDTFDDMSSKIGGSGEIDATMIATNAATLTPQPGKSYWMNRNTASQLVTTLSCTHRLGKIRSWHMIISKNAGAGDNFIPKFALTGLSQPFAAWSGGGVEPPVVSGVSHVMIAFTQIDQSVRAMVVDGW